MKGRLAEGVPEPKGLSFAERFCAKLKLRKGSALVRWPTEYLPGSRHFPEIELPAEGEYCYEIAGDGETCTATRVEEPEEVRAFKREFGNQWARLGADGQV